MKCVKVFINDEFVLVLFNYSSYRDVKSWKGLQILQASSGVLYGQFGVVFNRLGNVS